MVKVVGFLGKKRSGKDTSCDYIISVLKNLNQDVRKLAFAEPLKKIVGEMFNLTEDQLYGDLKDSVDPKWGISPRIMFQFVGTDLIRNNIHKILPTIGENFWVYSLEQKIKEFNNNTVVFISDVRFISEVELIHKLGGKVIKIERNIPSSGEILHQAEAEVDKITNYDFLVNNNSTIEELYKKILEIYSSI